MKNRILFAEDDPFNRLVFNALLKNEPYEITWVENGEAAIDTFRNSSFDLAIIDIRMPLKDGFEVASFIRAQPGSDLPILALTADNSPAEKRRCREAGMNAFLSKPVPGNQLLEEINRLLVGSPSE
ncbi:response regulator [Parasegetibacter sp. NRK P23]|uniref:response regulator n=1 Tax=Parasegetibacter sp. NRK P23 TaxID=2942999 RepID=UPI002043B5AF|nr:response regulator [Parasegetibacter sp. NRK P23]MCM5529674.1 response regulator [Parasegetibacter sp. NRK P23]